MKSSARLLTVMLLATTLSSGSLAARQFLSPDLFAEALGARKLDPDAKVVLTFPLAASPASEIVIPYLSLTYFDDGSTQVDGHLTGSTDGDRILYFLVDAGSLTYTATRVPVPEGEPPMYERFGSPRRPTLGKAGTPSSRTKPGDIQPMVPIEPIDPCCEDLCSGQHYAWMETRDPISIRLTRTDANSYWDVTEGQDGRCRWWSTGSIDCLIIPQDPNVSRTHWFVTGCYGSFPSGAYKRVSHSAEADYINWDFGSDNQSTTAKHTIWITRSGGSTFTNVFFSARAQGEYWFNLGFPFGDSGRNDCR